MLTVLGNSNSTTLADITTFILYSPTKCSVSFTDCLLIICYLRSFVLSNTKSPTLYPTASNLCLSAYYFMFSWVLASATLALLWTSFILSASYAIPLYFPFFLSSKPILGSCPLFAWKGNTLVPVCTLLL